MKSYYMTIKNGRPVFYDENGKTNKEANGNYPEGAFDLEIKMPTFQTTGKLVITYELILCESHEEVMSMINYVDK